MATIYLNQEDISGWTFPGSPMSGTVHGDTTDAYWSGSSAFGLLIIRPYISPVDLTGSGARGFRFEFDITEGSGAATMHIQIAVYTTPMTYYREFVLSSNTGHYSFDLSAADPVPGIESDAGTWDVDDFLQALLQVGGDPNGDLNVYAYLIMDNPGEAVSIENFALVADTCPNKRIGQDEPAAVLGTPNIVGSGAWNDDSDATYTELGTAVVSDKVRAMFTPTTGADTSEAWTLTIRASADIDQRLVWDVSTFGADFWDYGGQLDIDGGGGIQSFTHVLSSADVVFGTWGADKIGTAIQAGDAYLELFNNLSPGGGTITVYQAILYGSICGGRVFIPLRIHPRSDGLGTSTTPRIWPPPRSQQKSNRRAGGTYY